MLLLEEIWLHLRQKSFPAGANVTCLTYATDWWAVIGPVIHGESKSQTTRSSSDHVGPLHTLSTIDTQESKLGVRLVLEVLAKLMVGENSSWEFPKVGVPLILEVWLILETRRYFNKLLRLQFFKPLPELSWILLGFQMNYSSWILCAPEIWRASRWITHHHQHKQGIQRTTTPLSP